MKASIVNNGVWNNVLFVEADSVKQAIIDVNIDNDHDSLEFKSTSIFVFIFRTGVTNPYSLSKLLGYNISNVNYIIKQWKDNGIFDGNFFYLENDFNKLLDEEPMKAIMEITLISLCGAGKVVRYETN